MTREDYEELAIWIEAVRGDLNSWAERIEQERGRKGGREIVPHLDSAVKKLSTAESLIRVTL